VRERERGRERKGNRKKKKKLKILGKNSTPMSLGFYFLHKMRSEAVRRLMF
jgi:hypothetical protein